MSRPTIPQCAICGKLKGPSNRWFGAWEYDTPAFMIFPTDKAPDPSMQGEIDLCGEGCAQKALSQWMQKQQV